MKQYDVQDCGVVSLENAVFLYCAELHRVKALALKEIAYRVKFQTGAGTSYVNVQRIEDTE